MTVFHKFAALRVSDEPAVRLSAFYVAVFLIVGTYMSFLPLWLAAKGLSATQISLIYAIPVLMRPVFTTVLAFFADRSGRHAWVLKMLALGALLSLSILPFGDGFALIFVAFTLFAVFWTTVLPLTDAVTLSASRRGAADYGRIRLWGSLSYIAVTLAGGVAVDLFGPPAALWLFIGSAICVLLAAQWLPHMDAINSEPGTDLRKIRLSDVAALVRMPMLWLFLAASSAVQATHAVYYLFGTIHWTGIGISPTVVGMLWAIGVVTEIAVFAYGGRLVRSIGPMQLILIGGLTAALRWTLISFDPPLAALFVLQLTHGLTFGGTYLGTMIFMTRAFPPHVAATVQGLSSSFSAGVAIGSAYLAAGPLYRAFGAGAYLSMAGLAVVAVALTLALRRRWDGGILC